MKTVVIVNGEGMGRGDPDLGQRILKTFLGKAGALQGLDALVFYNAGVKALVEGSDLLQPLAALDGNGVDLIACGTCVDHFGLREQVRVGEVLGMDDILSRLSAAEKVITL